MRRSMLVAGWVTFVVFVVAGVSTAKTGGAYAHGNDTSYAADQDTLIEQRVEVLERRVAALERANSSVGLGPACKPPGRCCWRHRPDVIKHPADIEEPKHRCPDVGEARMELVTYYESVLDGYGVAWPGTDIAVLDKRGVAWPIIELAARGLWGTDGEQRLRDAITACQESEQ